MSAARVRGSPVCVLFFLQTIKKVCLVGQAPDSDGGQCDMCLAGMWSNGTACTRCQPGSIAVTAGSEVRRRCRPSPTSATRLAGVVAPCAALIGCTRLVHHCCVCSLPPPCTSPPHVLSMKDGSTAARVVLPHQPLLAVSTHPLPVLHPVPPRDLRV
jgi:hypothetical protein